MDTLKKETITKDEAINALEALDDLFKEGVPKTRKMNFLGHLNTIALLLEKLKRISD